MPLQYLLTHYWAEICKIRSVIVSNGTSQGLNSGLNSGMGSLGMGGGYGGGYGGSSYGGGMYGGSSYGGGMYGGMGGMGGMYGGMGGMGIYINIYIIIIIYFLKCIIYMNLTDDVLIIFFTLSIN